MNFISFEKAYSLYANETFEKRRSLVCESAGSIQEDAREKYVSRGWQLLTDVSDDEKESRRSSLREGLRWVGDRSCWTLPLDCEGVDLSRCITPCIDFPIHDYLGLHNWQLRYIPAPKISFKIFSSPVLKTNYVSSDKSLFRFLYPKILNVSVQLQKEDHLLDHNLSESDL
jgi:hypothetical protein